MANRAGRIKLWLVTISFVLIQVGTAFASTSERPPPHDRNNPPPLRHEERPPEPPPPPLRPMEERPPAPPPIQEERPAPPPRPEEPIPPPPPRPKEEGRGPTVIDGGRTPSGLTGPDVDALLAAGYSIDEIGQADAIAARHGIKAESLLAKRREGQTWDQIIAWASREYPAPNAPLVPESVMVSAVAKHTGLSEQEVQALREAGHDFNDISNAKHYAESYGLTIHEVLLQKGRRNWVATAMLLGANQNERLIAMVMERSGLTRDEVAALIRKGYNVLDLHQAAEAARLSGRTVEEILILRGERDWLQVLQEVFPASGPPQRTQAPTGTGGFE